MTEEDSVIRARCKELLLRRVAVGRLRPVDPENPQIVGGKYELISRLGEGGGGEVWKALHVDLQRTVALKFLKNNDGLEGAPGRRFLREARMMASFRHQNIIEIHDVCVDGPVGPYIVMEYLSGPSVHYLVATHGPLSWDVTCKIITDACAALVVAHARSLVHRDLKPSNIVLMNDGEGLATCKVIDFGLARVLDPDHDSSSITGTGALIGTPAYMSPEQYQGEDPDPRSDIYSLGCVMYYCLAGRPPFRGKSLAELAHQHCVGSIPSLEGGQLEPDLRAQVNGLLKAVLCKDPRQRIRSARSLAQAIETIDTYADSGKLINRRYPDRRRLKVLGAVVSTLVGFALLSGDVLEGAVIPTQYEGELVDGTPKEFASDAPPVVPQARRPSMDMTLPIPKPSDASQDRKEVVAPRLERPRNLVGEGKRANVLEEGVPLDTKRDTAESAVEFPELPSSRGMRTEKGEDGGEPDREPAERDIASGSLDATNVRIPILPSFGGHQEGAMKMKMKKEEM